MSLRLHPAKLGTALLHGASAVLGLLALTVIPESPLWLAVRRSRREQASTAAGDDRQRLPAKRTEGALRELFRPPLLRLTLLGIHIGSYPGVGAVCGLIYLLGFIAIWWAPDTSDKNLDA